MVFRTLLPPRLVVSAAYAAVLISTLHALLREADVIAAHATQLLIAAALVASLCTLWLQPLARLARGVARLNLGAACASILVMATQLAQHRTRAWELDVFLVGLAYGVLMPLLCAWLLSADGAARSRR